MLKSKIAMALAAAMVLAALYGCSSGVSDSTHNRVKDQVTGLQGTVDAIAAALNLPAGSTQAAILMALTSATADQLAAIRTQLELADNADAAAIVAAIRALQVEPEPPAPPVFVDQSGLPDDVKKMAGEEDIPAGESATIGEVMYTCAAGGEDCTVMVNADGAAVSTGGTVTVTVSSAYTMRKAAAVITKSAETKEKAIMVEGDQAANADAGLGGSDHVNADATDGNADDPYELSIKRGSTGGATIGIKDFGMDDEDEDPQFMQVMDLGNGRTMHERDNGKGVTEVVVVSTDIEMAEAVKFADFENAAGVKTQPLNADEDGEVATGEEAVAYDLGTGDLASTDAAAKAILDNMKSTSFARPTGDISSTTHTFLPAADDADPDTPGDQPRKAAMVDGSYNGADGTYTCSGTANCTVTVNAKGALTAATGGWIFTPDDGATSDQPDYEYLHYGFWLKKTTKDGVVTYNEVETFAGSSIDATGATTTVLGSATYEGGAVGVYVHELVNPGGTRMSATSGHFKAEVELKATFGQVTVDGVDTIADNVVDTVTGTIDEFELSGGEDASTWSVALSGDITPADGDASGTAKGNDPNESGSFSAIFHGPITAATDGTVPHPHSVVGEFNAGFTNGSVAGAFGAREVEED